MGWEGRPGMWAKEQACQRRSGAQQAWLPQGKGQGGERADSQGEGVDLLQIYFRPTHPGRAKDISLAADTRFPSWTRSQMWGGELEKKEKGNAEECWEKSYSKTAGERVEKCLQAMEGVSTPTPGWVCFQTDPGEGGAGVCVCVSLVTLPSFQETKPIRTTDGGIEALRAETGADLAFARRTFSLCWLHFVYKA